MSAASRALRGVTGYTGTAAMLRVARGLLTLDRDTLPVYLTLAMFLVSLGVWAVSDNVCVYHPERDKTEMIIPC